MTGLVQHVGEAVADLATADHKANLDADLAGLLDFPGEFLRLHGPKGLAVRGEPDL